MSSYGSFQYSRALMGTPVAVSSTSSLFLACRWTG